ncbi:hypothetical protein [Hydrogenophaga sp.]|uniref:hypothetical protein n=1 Tax=Hydrogenophaga sp. TaxID=1904254 RepID=UPI003D113D63
MRHIVLALMIALLPIRGWMGDAMAVAMLAAPAHAMEHSAQAGPAPCPDHAVPSQGITPLEASAQHGDMVMDGTTADEHHAHKSCDVCNGPAMAAPAPGPLAAAPAHGLLTPPAERFASSEPQRGIKPPIS